MNGHDHPEYFEPPDDYPGDDHDPETRAGIECPFCGHEVEHDGMLLFCDNCEVVWHSEDEIEQDRLEPAPGWSDVFAEDRGV